MKIQFERTMQHLVDFQKFYWRHSAAAQRAYRWGFVGGPVSALLVAYLLRDRSALVITIAVITALALYSAGYMWSVQCNFTAVVNKMLEEGHGRALLGSHEIEIGPGGVDERTEHNASHQSWSAIERVVEDDRYIFIYTQPVAAHVIPKTAFESSDGAGAFVRRARELHGGGAG